MLITPTNEMLLPNEKNKNSFLGEITLNFVQGLGEGLAKVGACAAKVGCY